jgi:hypothetical protein
MPVDPWRYGTTTYGVVATAAALYTACVYALNLGPYILLLNE